jgi:hypothetical protein
MALIYGCRTTLASGRSNRVRSPLGQIGTGSSTPPSTLAGAVFAAGGIEMIGVRWWLSGMVFAVVAVILALTPRALE